MIKALWHKYRSLILYVFFGGCTTLVNVLVYTGGTRLLRLDEMWANAAAWALSVLFAYLTNRRWVFGSRARGLGPILREAASFFAARVATGLLDQVIMFLCVKALAWHDLWVKIGSNILVIILNYVLSKWVVFRKK